MNICILICIVTLILGCVLWKYYNSNYLILTYSRSGGIQGWSLKLEVYKNNEYIIYKHGKPIIKGYLDTNQRNIIDNIINIISKMKIEYEKPILGNDILYENVFIKNKSIKLDKIQYYEGTKLLTDLIDFKLKINNI